MTNTDNPQTHNDANFEAWDQVATPDTADSAFASLVEADTAAQNDWDHEYHATLGQLRRELGRSQAQVAVTMATHQPQVSEIERRDDILVSTARSLSLRSAPTSRSSPSSPTVVESSSTSARLPGRANRVPARTPPGIAGTPPGIAFPREHRRAVGGQRKLPLAATTGHRAMWSEIGTMTASQPLLTPISCFPVWRE